MSLRSSTSALLFLAACGGGAPGSPAAPAPTPGAPAPGAPPAGAPAAAPPAGAPAGGRPNVLFIVVDTLRADALGVYGQALPTSPNIDALARRGVVFDRAWTQYTWTIPSFISYMSSRFARTHGWEPQMGKLSDYEVLDERAPMLAEVLKGAGYTTTGQYSNVHLKPELGLGRGFDVWTKGADVGVVRGSVAQIQKWKSTPQPDFLYVHLMSPHEPHMPTDASLAAVGSARKQPEPTAAIGWRLFTEAPADKRAAVRQDLQQVYLASVRDADTNVGTVLEALAASGEAENTLVIFTSDHGEMLGEHDQWGHNGGVWDALSRVPLIVTGPGMAPARVTDRVGRLVDIAPMVLGRAGLPVPPTWQGQDLLGGPAPLAVAERDGLAGFSRDGVRKSVEERAKEQFVHGFDLAADPGEAAPVKDAAGYAELIQAAAAWRAAVPKASNEGAVLSLDEAERKKTVEQLKAIGYTE